MLVGLDVPAEGGSRLVGLPALAAQEGLLSRVAQHVVLQVVLAAAAVRTHGTLERLDALVHPQVLLQLRVGPSEHTLAVRAFVGVST